MMGLHSFLMLLLSSLLFCPSQMLAARVQSIVLDGRNKSWQMRLIAAMESAEERGHADKVKWAERWMALRSSADFTPWNAGLAKEAMEVPTLCAAEYTLNGEIVKYPSVSVPLWGEFGGSAISHTFMVFSGKAEGKTTAKKAKAGDKPTKRKGCEVVLERIATTRAGTKTYQKLQMQAASLGCLSLEPWGAAASRIHVALQEELQKLSDLNFRFINRTGEPLGEAIMRVTRRSIRSQNTSKAEKLTKAVIDELQDWVFHSLSKYASKSGPDLWAAVRRSLLRTHPKVRLQAFADGKWEWSPKSKCRVTGDGLHDCDSWNLTIPDHIKEIQIKDETLAMVLGAVEKVQEVANSSDWALLAQTPAVFAAVGFDKIGILDNGGWECGKVEARCAVQPQCARVAAQMLAYPFGGDKTYASSWTKKAQTFASNLWGGKFDSDGFHSSCHVPGGAYCWSYTDCLQEMLKWLCAQNETAGSCCPSAQVAYACREDVNGGGCNVCVKSESDGRVLTSE